MARPKKQTVDYFPHDTDASSRRTLTILQHRFGNDGYAFWFKTLEVLGQSPGHFFDFNDAQDWEFLLAKTGIKDPETARTILDALSTLEAIDRVLYSKGVIWSQNFVDNIADVYRRRNTSMPLKPVYDGSKYVPAFNNEVNDDSKPQRKGKERKLNKSKVEEVATTTADGYILLFSKYFPYCFGRDPNSREAAQLRDLGIEIAQAGVTASEQQIKDAFAEAARHNKLSVSYVRGVLLDWLGVPR